MKFPLRWAIGVEGDRWKAQAWSRASESSYRTVPLGLVVTRLFETYQECWGWLRRYAAKAVARRIAEYGRPLNAMELAAIDPATPPEFRDEILDALLEKEMKQR